MKVWGKDYQDRLESAEADKVAEMAEMDTGVAYAIICDIEDILSESTHAPQDARNVVKYAISAFADRFHNLDNNS